MRLLIKYILVTIITLVSFVHMTAHAGRTCDKNSPSIQIVEKGMALALKTAQALDADYAARSTRVVVIARAGQDLGKYGLRYSHLGFGYRTNEGKWLVAHKLNTCSTADASLYRHGLGEFFMDDLFRYEGAWVVPNTNVQEKLLKVLLDKNQVTKMNARPYNMASYAWGTKYQQSNQWVLETIAAAMDDNIQTREQAQSWIKQNGYIPTTLIIGPLTRLGGRVGSANIAFDDHPNDKRFSDQIQTVTVDSMFAWMPRVGLSGKAVAVFN